MMQNMDNMKVKDGKQRKGGHGDDSNYKGDLESQSDQFSMINDKYDGFGVDLFGKNDAPRESQVLNSTFLGGLKVHQVRDSDSEEYF